MQSSFISPLVVYQGLSGYQNSVTLLFFGRHNLEKRVLMA